MRIKIVDMPHPSPLLTGVNMRRTNEPPIPLVWLICYTLLISMVLRAWWQP